MHGHARLGLSVLVAALVILPATAQAAMKCERGYQRVQGNLIFSPYCQDEYLAVVARQYGLKVSARRLRNDPNYKKEVCRTVFTDIRVQETCLTAGVPEWQGAP